MEALLVRFAFFLACVFLSNNSFAFNHPNGISAFCNPYIGSWGPKNAQYGACQLGAGLVKAGIAVEQAVQICASTLDPNEVTIQQLVQKGLVNIGDLSAIAQTKELTAVCAGSAASYAASRQ